MLPTGRRVTEVVMQRGFPGWVPIHPRGFLREEDVTPVEEAPWLTESLYTPKDRRASTGSLRRPRQRAVAGGAAASGDAGSENVEPVVGEAACGERQRPRGSLRTPSRRVGATFKASSPRVAGEAMQPIWALREEQVRLREANVSLKEESLEAQQKLDGARKEREAIQRELEELKAARAAEQADLEWYRGQRGRLREKLTRAREVVFRTIGHVDRLYSPSDALEVDEVAEQAAESALEAGDILAQLEEDGLEGADKHHPGAVKTPECEVDSKENALPANVVGDGGEAKSAKPGDLLSPVADAGSARPAEREALRVLGGVVQNGAIANA